MGIKIKHKSRHRRSAAPETPEQPQAPVATRASETILTGEALEVLEEAASRLNPRPDVGNWKKMARGLAVQKSVEGYFDRFVDEHRESVGWDWATLWICHTFLCEAGLIEAAERIYKVMIEFFPRDYHTELCYGRMCRDFKGEYFDARDHMRYAASLWNEGCEAYYQMGILYDLLGMPKFAFAMEERAMELADQFGESSYKLKAQLAFNQAVAMWQAARPYGDIKAYLRHALKEWPEYERAQKFLDSLPEDDEADPKGRSAMQRLSDDVRQNMNRPSYHIIEPEAAGQD